VQKRTTPITVESGGTASYNVLPDWIDPDGDDIFLLDVRRDRPARCTGSSWTRWRRRAS
jgi:hypothetical protein